MLNKLVPKPGFGTGVNWSNPLTSRLCFATLFNEWGSTQCQNLVGQTRGVFTGTTKPSWVGGVAAGLSFPGGANTVGYLSFGTETFATDLGRNTSNPATIAFRLYQRSTASSGIAARNDNNTVGAGWQIACSTSGTLTYLHEATTSNMSFSVVVPLNRWITVVIVTDGSLTAANQRAYLNGGLATHNTDTNGSGTPGSDAAQTLYIGRTNFSMAGIGAVSLNGSLGWFYMWKRMLSFAEVKTLTENPYQIVEKGNILEASVPAAIPTSTEKTQTFIIMS